MSSLGPGAAWGGLAPGLAHRGEMLYSLCIEVMKSLGKLNPHGLQLAVGGELWLAFGVHVHSSQAGPPTCPAFPSFPDHRQGRAGWSCLGLDRAWMAPSSCSVMGLLR